MALSGEQYQLLTSLCAGVQPRLQSSLVIIPSILELLAPTIMMLLPRANYIHLFCITYFSPDNLKLYLQGHRSMRESRSVTFSPTKFHNTFVVCYSVAFDHQRRFFEAYMSGGHSPNKTTSLNLWLFPIRAVWHLRLLCFP